MVTVVFINRLQPADGKRDALIGLLRVFADSINADPECLPYSVHEPIDDEATRLTVIQGLHVGRRLREARRMDGAEHPATGSAARVPARPSGPAPVGIAGRR